MKNTPPKIKIDRYAVLLLIIILLMFVFCGKDHAFVRFWVVERNIGGDFENYISGGRMIRAGVMDIYNLEIYDRFMEDQPELQGRHLNYPPIVYGLFSYVTHLGTHRLKIMWYYLNIILLMASVAVMLASGTGKKFTPPGRVAMILYCIIFAFLFSPVQDNLFMGQVNIVLLFFMSLAFLCYRRKMPGLAGALLGTAAAIKLFPGIVLLFFISRRQWKAVAGFLSAFLGFFLAGLLLFGPSLTMSFFQHSPGGYFSWFGQSSVWLQSVPSFIIFLMGLILPGAGIQPAIVQGFSMLVGLLFLGFTCFHSYRCPEFSGDGETGLFSAFVCTIFLVSPLVWPYHLVLLLVTLPLIWHHSNFSARTSFSGPLVMMMLIGIFGGVVPNSFHPWAKLIWGMRGFFLMNRLTPLAVAVLWYMCLRWAFHQFSQESASREKEAPS